MFLIEEFGIDNEMEVGVPLLSALVEGDFKGVDTAPDFGFPFLRSAEPSERGFEFVDLVGETVIVGDGSKCNKFCCVEGRYQAQDPNEDGSRPGLGAEWAESAFASTFRDSDCVRFSINHDDW